MTKPDQIKSARRAKRIYYYLFIILRDGWVGGWEGMDGKVCVCQIQNTLNYGITEFIHFWEYYPYGHSGIQGILSGHSSPLGPHIYELPRPSRPGYQLMATQSVGFPKH